jgi:hypothetical protein
MAKNDVEKLAHLVLRPLRHDGKHYPRGSYVQLGEKEAAPLIRTGVLAKPEPKSAAE